MSNRYRDHESVRSTYMDWPKDKRVDFYKPPENGRGSVDIVPFVIATEKHPLVAKRKAKVGELDYCLDIWVHRSVGPAEMDFLCLAKNYNRRCALCEAAEERLNRYGKEDPQYKNLRMKHRTVYNVYDNIKNDSVMYIFDVSPYLFEEEIKKIADRLAARKGLPFLDYGNFNFATKPEEGLSIWFETFKENKGGFPTTCFRDITFRKHEKDYEITQKDVDKALSLDKYLILRDFEEMSQILYGDDDSLLAEESNRRGEPEETPRGSSGRGATEPSGRGGSREESLETSSEERPPEGENRSARGGRGAEPAGNEGSRGRGGNTPPDEGLLDDDLPFKEGPREKEVPGASQQENLQRQSPGCPQGLLFGIDTGRFPVCDSCNIYNKCFAAKIRQQPPGEDHHD